MSLLAFVAAMIFGLMIAEWRLAVHNETRLLAQGATIPRGDVWPLMVVGYIGASVVMVVEGLNRVPDSAPAMDMGAAGPNWFAAGVVLFVASKWLKYWAISSLGSRWTFRILVLPGAPLVAGGPYRYVTHPNYIAVIGELAGTAMMMGARTTGLPATLVFGIVLWLRIRHENRVLEAIRRAASS